MLTSVDYLVISSLRSNTAIYCKLALQPGQKAPFDVQASSPSLSPNNQPTPLTTSPTTPLASNSPTSGLIPLGSATGSSHTGSSHHSSHHNQEGSGSGSPGPSGGGGNGTASNKTK